MSVVNKKFSSWSRTADSPVYLPYASGGTEGVYSFLISHNSVGAPAKGLAEWQRSWTQSKEVETGFTGALNSPMLGPSRNGSEEVSTYTKTGTFHPVSPQTGRK